MSPTTFDVFAPAKINLTLHVTGQRADGYHLLDSLVAFATVGDSLRIAKGNTLSLTVEGPETNGVPADMDNLALRAAALVEPNVGAALVLEKHLPAASGIGGGSADAAAAFRGMLTLLGNSGVVEKMLSASDAELKPFADRLLALGADVPMCLLSRSARVRGIGERIVPVNLPPLPTVLVNPRVPVATPDVFGRLVRKDNMPMPDQVPEFEDTGMLINWLVEQRNDLEAPALRVAPEIGDVLCALNNTADCRLARMSGSGATCFGLYPDVAAAKAAAEVLYDAYPSWWVAGCILQDQFTAALPVVS